MKFLSPRSFGRLSALALLALPILAGCRHIHDYGYKKTKDIGVESFLWREELKDKRIGVAVYTNAINDMPEAGVLVKLGGPKSSSRMKLTPDASRVKSFNFLNIRSLMTLGLSGAPYNHLANGAGWNTKTTLDGYPLSMPSEDFNESIYAASRAAFESLGAQVKRLDESETDNISMGHLAHSNQNYIDYLWVVRHVYEFENDGLGNAKCVSEIRASLFDTRLRHRLFGLFGKKPQKRWIKYRRTIETAKVPIASEARIPGEKSAPKYVLQFSKESRGLVLNGIFAKIQSDLADWPHKNPQIHAAQRPGIPMPEF